MIKLIVFDLDGTLLNSIGDLAVSSNTILKKFGYPEHDVSEYCYMVGDGIPKLIERALPESARIPQVLEPFEKEFLAYYALHKAEQTKPYPGIVEMLERLLEHGIMLAVASNKEHRLTEELVATYFGTDVFSCVSGKRSGVPPKPDPAVVDAIIRSAGVKKEEVIYVGDTSVDMFTARNCGVLAIGVSWGFRTRQELQESGANEIIDLPEELLRHIR